MHLRAECFLLVLGVEPPEQFSREVLMQKRGSPGCDGSAAATLLRQARAISAAHWLVLSALRYALTPA
jgi:hypothetical protein